MHRQLALIAAAPAVMLPLPLAADARPGLTVVLGRLNLLPHGVGWGTAHPRVIFNGGDPNGRAWDLEWSRWAGPTASGRGLTWIFRPQGGYFARPGVIELRASAIGHCSPHGPSAYTRLEARESLRPAGPLGRWFAWGGWSSICHGP